MSQGTHLDRFIYTYGLVPARYTIESFSSYFSGFQQILAFFSYMFLHGGFLHLIGNSWFLYIFGDNVEDRLGHLRYLVFYLLCGMASGAAHLLLNRYSTVPTIGASGAIAGVMGAYFLSYPRAKILTLIPILFIPWFVEISAFFFLAAWLVYQLVRASGILGGGGGIAWWAHIGGFLFGMLALKTLDQLPKTGLTSKVGRITQVKSSPRLQVIRPVGLGPDPHLYGTILITAHEARIGTRKLVSIPRGYRKRLFRVSIPERISDGKMLRLRGLGKQIGTDRFGDLLLKVTIE
jgi:membrane associated rhomboid family serine protease